ncbi:MAG: dTDP-4-dehydrorhamnose reductase [Pseudomonadota bacterium]
MKILITGGTGQLGRDCEQVLQRIGDVVAVGSKDVDISRLSDVEKTVRHVAPDIIINCAAFTNVDACETESRRCREVNVIGPRNLASSVETYGGRLIHISSDYVFDGKKPFPEPYVEEDSPNPLSVYGKSKLEGEDAIRRATARYTILRTAWLYGINGRNFLKTILGLALKESGKQIKVVNDQFGSPTWSRSLAIQISKMIGENLQGTYHATSEGYCSWHELAVYFLEKMGVFHTVTPCTSDDYPAAATRPRNSILENRRLKEKGIDLMAPWKTDLNQYISEFGDRLMRELE